ncbi:MAG: hypothetical protein IJK28_06600 [Clostridia bacterium]|nr:hypothetical protein [Clostridia bacterium]
MNTPIILTLNLLEDSIMLNEGVLDALDWPRQVQIMINKDEKMLLLRACTIDDQQAVVVPEERTVQFEISGRSLLRKIRQMVGWDDDCPRMCYGEYLPAHQAIRFNLMEAEPVDMDQQ